MNLEGAAALVAAGAAVVTSVAAPAAYLQARAARIAANNAVKAARITAHAHSLESRRAAQRDAYIRMLAATNAFDVAATSRSLAPIVSNDSIEDANDRMIDAYDELMEAVAVVSLDVPETLLPVVERVRNHTQTLYYSCQTHADDTDDSQDEKIWHVAGENGDEIVSAYRVDELFEEARKDFIQGVREYLNADVQSTP